MRVACVLLAAALALPATVSAQDCYDCVLGIWDDPALTTNRGSIVPYEPKTVYVGMKLSQDMRDFAGVEFSVAGLEREGLYLLGATPLGPRALVFGTVPAPEDTTALSEGVGGVTAAWSTCLEGNVALIKLVLYTVEELEDQVLLVKRSYPTTNSEWHTPVLVRCDPPQYSIARVSGGCYLLNPSGAASDCYEMLHGEVAVSQTTWSGMKQLYR